MKATFTRDQIVNKHGQPIYHWSKQSGNTELEKFTNYNKSYKTIQYIIKDKQGNDVIAIVDTEKSINGYSLHCFNHLEENILTIDDCHSNDVYGVEQSLEDYDLI